MPKKKSFKDFIISANKKFGNKFDFSKSEKDYKNLTKKITIICPEHGEFNIAPHLFLRSKYGCPKCGKTHTNDKVRDNTNIFIKKAKEVHGDKYDYSKVEYKNNKEKVCIICPEHGEFWQTPHMHLAKHGCPICAGNKDNRISFIKKACETHGNKYDYSKVNYINSQTKVCIICPEHGEFWQTPRHHLKGIGCQHCAKQIFVNKVRKTKEEFIKEAEKIHKGKYCYKKVNYITTLDKVCIICPIHGEFWQTPASHLKGSGCPKCKTSKLELEVLNYLNENNIKYFYNERLPWMENLRLDFYLPNFNIAIECQGRQHFEVVDFGGKGEEFAKKEFDLIKIRDKRKKELCEKHNDKIIYILKNDKITDILNKIIYGKCI